jgi:hypothetical protein
LPMAHTECGLMTCNTRQTLQGHSSAWCPCLDNVRSHYLRLPGNVLSSYWPLR